MDSHTSPSGSTTTAPAKRKATAMEEEAAQEQWRRASRPTPAFQPPNIYRSTTLPSTPSQTRYTSPTGGAPHAQLARVPTAPACQITARPTLAKRLGTSSSDLFSPSHPHRQYLSLDASVYDPFTALLGAGPALDGLVKRDLARREEIRYAHAREEQSGYGGVSARWQRQWSAGGGPARDVNAQEEARMNNGRREEHDDREAGNRPPTSADASHASAALASSASPVSTEQLQTSHGQARPLSPAFPSSSRTFNSNAAPAGPRPHSSGTPSSSATYTRSQSRPRRPSSSNGTEAQPLRRFLDEQNPIKTDDELIGTSGISYAFSIGQPLSKSLRQKLKSFNVVDPGRPMGSDEGWDFVMDFDDNYRGKIDTSFSTMPTPSFPLLPFDPADLGDHDKRDEVIGSDGPRRRSTAILARKSAAGNLTGPQILTVIARLVNWARSWLQHQGRPNEPVFPFIAFEPAVAPIHMWQIRVPGILPMQYQGQRWAMTRLAYSTHLILSSIGAGYNLQTYNHVNFGPIPPLYGIPPNPPGFGGPPPPPPAGGGGAPGGGGGAPPGGGGGGGGGAPGAAPGGGAPPGGGAGGGAGGAPPGGGAGGGGGGGGAGGEESSRSNNKEKGKGRTAPRLVDGQARLSPAAAQGPPIPEVPPTPLLRTAQFHADASLVFVVTPRGGGVASIRTCSALEMSEATRFATNRQSYAHFSPDVVSTVDGICSFARTRLKRSVADVKTAVAVYEEKDESEVRNGALGRVMVAPTMGPTSLAPIYQVKPKVGYQRRELTRDERVEEIEKRFNTMTANGNADSTLTFDHPLFEDLSADEIKPYRFKAYKGKDSAVKEYRRFVLRAYNKLMDSNKRKLPKKRWEHIQLEGWPKDLPVPSITLGNNVLRGELFYRAMLCAFGEGLIKVRKIPGAKATRENGQLRDDSDDGADDDDADTSDTDIRGLSDEKDEIDAGDDSAELWEGREIFKEDLSEEEDELDEVDEDKLSDRQANFGVIAEEDDQEL